MESEQSLYCGMAFCRDPLKLEGSLGRMQDGIIRAGYSIGIEAVSAARLGRAKSFSRSPPLTDDKASVHATRTPSRMTAL